MKIHSESRLRHPLATVYATYRDRMPEIAAYMPDIDRIEVRSRAQGPKGPRLLNVWHAKNNIPKVAQGIVKPEWLYWEDHAEWDDQNTWVDWTLIVPTFREGVKCSGRNQFIADGAGTRVLLTGDLQIAIRDVPGVPRLLAGRIAPKVEEFIVKLVTPNLERVNDSLGAFLDAQG
jgi:hypothetical protein